MAGPGFRLVSTALAALALLSAAPRASATQLEEDGAAWATGLCSRLVASGLPSRVVDQGSSRAVLSACTDAIFDLNVPRSLAFAEVFAGTAQVTEHIRTTHMLSAVAFDKLYGEHCDACNLCGCLYLCYLLASVMQAGVVHFSPEFSSRVFDAGVSFNRRPAQCCFLAQRKKTCCRDSHRSVLLLFEIP